MRKIDKLRALLFQLTDNASDVELALDQDSSVDLVELRVAFDVLDLGLDEALCLATRMQKEEHREAR